MTEAHDGEIVLGACANVGAPHAGKRPRGAATGIALAERAEIIACVGGEVQHTQARSWRSEIEDEAIVFY